MSTPADATTTPAPTMQEVILRLQEFWTSRGCVLSQPLNTEVGAGTANPSTLLRVLGPEPWNVAYVEPSVRPDDARYGENPNRLQMHTQFQVILKPDPGNPQELYLESLAALGIDIDAHDIRFVEDNWASPALGAWGLGWEVWLDGLEITQFTYFQQAGGLTLDPVSVELTYGLERIVMALQGVTHFTDIQFSEDISYGELFLQNEYEMSRYYLDDADVERTQALFDSYAEEAQEMLDKGLPIPAHLCVLKCSHLFNVLDSRGAISTTERARSFGLMRKLMRSVATLWADKREEMGHPLGVLETPSAAELPAAPQLDSTETVLIEIGTEELPAQEVPLAAEAVRADLAEQLGASALEHGEITVVSTPRRIVATIADVAPREADTTNLRRGPRTQAAYDADGQPSKALQGFLRGNGGTVEDVITVEQDGGEYVAIEQHVPGRGTAEVLGDIVPAVVANLSGPTNMRWNDPELAYIRAIRWLVVMHGDTHVPVRVSALTSGTTTQLIRTSTSTPVEVTTADGYLDWLADHGVTADREVRRAAVVAEATRLAESVGGTLDADAEAGLIDEITDLVEAPTPILGDFDADYLSVPEPVLTTVMRKHQRYLPVRDADGALMAHFITFANGPCEPAKVKAGNEAVIRARFEDAAYFWRADLTTSPEEFRSRLTSLLFEETLGSMDQRVTRIATLADRLADRLGLDATDRAVITRAGELGKFDLTTQLGVELSSLAGVLAQEYAARAGEPEAVALALREMELPSSATSALPESVPGAVLSLADRLDHLASMFTVGAIPTGTSDPFGVRRTAISLVRVLRAHPALSAIALDDGIEMALEVLAEAGNDVADDTGRTATDFVLQRLEGQLLDAGAEHRLVQAAMPLGVRPASVDAALAQLVELDGTEPMQRVTEAVGRAVRIVRANRDVLAAEQPAPAETPAAQQALEKVVTDLETGLDGRAGDLQALVDAADGVLPDAVATFFEDVQVMSPDPAEQRARLAVLARIEALSGGIDWTVL